MSTKGARKNAFIFCYCAFEAARCQRPSICRCAFCHPDSNLSDRRAPSSLKYSGLVLGLARNTDSDISPTPPLNFTGCQKVRNLASIFNPSPLSRLGFEREQHIGNVKHQLKCRPTYVLPKFRTVGALQL